MRAGVDGDACLLGVGDRRERLERKVQALLGAEGMIENVIRFGEGLVDIAEPQFGIQRQIGVFLPFQMLEVRE